jgi:hypothetical protein
MNNSEGGIVCCFRSIFNLGTSIFIGKLILGIHAAYTSAGLAAPGKESVIDVIPLDVSSLKVIEPEFVVTLQKATLHLEAYIADHTRVRQLSASRKCIRDIAGILKLLEMMGAHRLAVEMSAILKQMIQQHPKVSDFSLKVLSRGYVWMACYIEYVSEAKLLVPALALPLINEVRAGLHKPLILESGFAKFRYTEPMILSSSRLKKDKRLAVMVPQLSRMYQAGLVGLLRENNPQIQMRLMHRAMARLAKSVGDVPVRTQWRLTEAVLEGLLYGSLTLNYTRKRVLSLVQRECAKFEEDCENPAITASTALLNELVYLVNLSTKRGRASLEVFDKLGLKRFSVSDRVFQRRRAIMHGPSTDTILTMVKALQEELTKGKEIVDLASRAEPGNADITPLILMFQHTANILFVVGLPTPSEILLEIKCKVESWVERANFSLDNLHEIADGILYIESVLDNLRRGDLDFQAAQTEQTRLAIMAKTQLDKAELVVIQQARAGLATVEKNINDFVKSKYRKSHMRRVVGALASVRGGVRILKLDRAAAVLLDFENFVQSLVRLGVRKKDIPNMLETLADSLMAVEYYLSELELHGEAPPGILDLAERSLATSTWQRKLPDSSQSQSPCLQ